MTSPITVTTTPLLVAPLKVNRREIKFQNTGNRDIYLKKQTGRCPVVPSITNYDHKLEENETLSVITISAFMAVALANATTSEEVVTPSNGNGNGNNCGITSTLAILETTYVSAC